MAAFAYAYLEGTVQLAVYGVALVDAIVTPQILIRITVDSFTTVDVSRFSRPSKPGYRSNRR